MGVYSKGLRLLALALFFMVGGFAKAAERPLFNVTGGFIDRTFAAGKTTQWDLRALLTNPNNPDTLKWTMNNPPSWVSITGDTMTVTPPTTGSGTTSFMLVVALLNPPPGMDGGDFKTVRITSGNPPVWGNANLGKWNEKSLLSVDLTKLATQPDGQTLAFSIKDPRTNANWLSINGTKLEGTPQRANVGAFDLILVARTPLGLEAEIKAFGEVLKVIQPPKFLANPIVLPDATEDLPYSDTLSKASLISNPEGGTITFAATAGKPNWLTLAANGALSGTPLRADGGAVSMTVRLSSTIDGQVFTDTSVVRFTVKLVNKAPQWSRNPIVLPDAPVKKPATANLATFASDIDGNTLTYKKLSGPAWADVSTTGTFSGTPANANIGLNTFQVEVSDGALTAVTEVQIKVVNSAPVWTSNPIILKNAKEDFDYLEALKSYATDADGDLLSFEMISGPAWVTVGSDGAVKGIPRRANLGLNTLRVRVSDGINTPVEAEARITVDRTNKAPEWTQNPIQLKDAPERSPYTESIANFATDPDSDVLTFAKVSGPAWVSISSTGAVTGTPQRADVGTATIVVRVSDREPLSSTVTVLINVLKVNRAPTWTVNPIQLPNAIEDSAFSHSIGSLAVDADGDSLVFKKVSGPAWLQVAGNGALSGTPRALDVGAYTAVFEVTDGEAAVTVNANGTVLKANKAPSWTQNPIVLPNGRAKESYQQDISAFATDPDGDQLTITKISGPGWANISTNGLVTGIPQTTDIGLNSFSVQVSDGKLTAITTVRITVDKAFEPPKWSQDPILLPDATEGQMFSFNLLPLVTDPENDPLTFTKLNGPAWLTLSPQGQLTGVPQKADVGNYTAVFQTSDGKFQVSVGATGRVIPKNDPPTINQNALTFTVKERQTLVVNLNGPGYIQDPEGDTLTFNLLDTRNWVVLTNRGNLTLTPKHGDVGNYTLRFTVADPTHPAVSGTLTINVVEDPIPPKWKEDPIRFTAKADTLFNATIADKVTEIDGLPLTFIKKMGPAWLTVNNNGTLTGTPAESDVGENTFQVTARSTLGSDVTVIITVQTGNTAPKWLKDPIVLPDAMVGSAYNQSLISFVTDAEGDPLRFEKLSGPDWAFLTPAGLFIGVPAAADIGTSTYRVRVRDSKNAFADVTVMIPVKTPNKPPVWTQIPLNLGEATVNLPFNFNLVPFVRDPENDPLTFKKISGPTWLIVTTSGQIAGTPRDADLGEFTAIFEVSDGTSTARVDAFGKVVKGNKPPVLNLANLVFIVKERQTLTVNLNQPLYVTDAEGDALTFSIAPSAGWMTFTSAGSMTLRPQKEQVGEHTFQLTVTDAKNLSATGPLIVKVIADPRKPMWLENPIRFTAMENKAFAASIADRVFNPVTGTTVTFAKVSGPAWLTVSSSGMLSGTPRKADIGINNFVVSATNSDGSATADVIIDVKKDDSQGEDSIRIDDPVPGARADNLWVVDNSPTCNGPGTCLIYDLQRDIEQYFRALDKAGVHHLGVYYSSDACHYLKPILDNQRRLLIHWDDTDNAASFNQRVNNSKGESRYNSPLTQMVRFFRDVPGSSGSSPFFENEVPLDAMIVTAHPDQYKTFQTNGSITQGWKVADFVSYYQKIANGAKKPMRINAIAPLCPTTTFPSYYAENETCYAAYPTGENPYQQVVRSTGGKFYSYHNRTSVRDALLDYADRVIFSATVTAHKRIQLSAVPSDPSKIVVKLAGKVLPGNTGAATDQWSYDSGANQIIVYWNRIDRSGLKPGDRLEITYPKNVVRSLATH